MPYDAGNVPRVEACSEIPGYALFWCGFRHSLVAVSLFRGHRNPSDRMGEPPHAIVGPKPHVTAGDLVLFRFPAPMETAASMRKTLPSLILFGGAHFGLRGEERSSVDICSLKIHSRAGQPADRITAKTVYPIAGGPPHLPAMIVKTLRRPPLSTSMKQSSHSRRDRSAGRSHSLPTLGSLQWRLQKIARCILSCIRQFRKRYTSIPLFE